MEGIFGYIHGLAKSIVKILVGEEKKEIVKEVADKSSGAEGVQQIARDAVEESSGIIDFILGIIFHPITIIIISLLIVIGLMYLVKYLASKDIIWTMVKEGQAKMIMGAGGSGFHRAIMQFEGKDFSKEPGKKWDVVDSTALKNSFDKLKGMIGLKGIKYLGIPGMHIIHEYKFRWNSVKQAPDEKTTSVNGIHYTAHEGEDLKYIILQNDVYYARVQAAEDKDMVPLDIDLTLEIYIENPYKALFKAQEWLELTWGVFLPEVRKYVNHEKWENLSNDTIKHEEVFEKTISNAKAILRENFGVVVVKFRMLRIGTAGERAKIYEEAATEAFKAENEAKAVSIKASAEKERMDKVYGTIQSYGDLGREIRRIEGLENVSKGPGNTIISAPELSGLAAAFAGLGTNKSASAKSKEEKE